MALRLRMIMVFTILVVAISLEMAACSDSDNSKVVTSNPTSQAITQTPTFTPMYQSMADGLFFLEITSPAQSEVIEDKNSIVVAGRTTQDAAVSVNDDFVDVDIQGHFQTTVSLSEDINIIEVIASTIDGAQLDQVLTVIYSP